MAAFKSLLLLLWRRSWIFVKWQIHLFEIEDDHVRNCRSYYYYYYYDCVLSTVKCDSCCINSRISVSSTGNSDLNCWRTTRLTKWTRVSHATEGTLFDVLGMLVNK